MRNRILFILVCSLLFISTNAEATKDTICITLRPSDTTGVVIGTQNPNTSQTPTGLFYSATWTCAGPTCLDRGLIKFDLSAIPSNATITTATLSLYADNNAN